MMKIAHGENDLRQALLLTPANGAEDRQVMTYSMTDAQSTTQLRGMMLESRVSWKGPEMVIESRYAGSVFRDYWSLSADGRTLTMEHRDDAMAGQLTVLERVETGADVGSRGDLE